MQHDKQITFRLPAELILRAEALVSAVRADPERGAFGRVSKAAVLRLAIVKGLAVLEAEYRREEEER